MKPARIMTAVIGLVIRSLTTAACGTIAGGQLEHAPAPQSGRERAMVLRKAHSSVVAPEQLPSATCDIVH
jgi:hypothetical protein